jgi:hypothetical protein
MITLIYNSRKYTEVGLLKELNKDIKENKLKQKIV